MSGTLELGLEGGVSDPDNVTDWALARFRDRYGPEITKDGVWEYMSGRSPLHWAMESLRIKHDKASGIVDDPNRWHAWRDEPFELIRHLRRLVAVSVETARIVAALPPSLPKDSS